MAERFYRIDNDMSHGRRWYLRGPIDAHGREVDPRRFTAGVPITPPGPLHIPLRRPGPAWDFTLADFDMPVVSAALGAHFERLAPGAVQRFPVSVQSATEPYEILNLVRRRRCFDEAASRIQYVTHDALRPERVGAYEMILEAVIDSAQVRGERLFRAAGWEIMIVCDGEVHDALIERAYSGFSFEQLGVSPLRPAV